MVRTIPRLMITAAAIGVVSVWVGLTLSYYLGTAGSATMALVPVALFFIVMALKEIPAVTRKREATR